MDTTRPRPHALGGVHRTHTVDIAFRGSTSIEKVLPVLAPETGYEGLEIADGAAAMEGWLEMARMLPGADRAERRRALLAYCEQDTLAMLRIFQFLRDLPGEKPG